MAWCFSTRTSVATVLTTHPCISRCLRVNSLVPGRFEWNFTSVIFKLIVMIDGWGISCEIALIWMSLDFTDDQSTLVQVMAWCRQAPSQYLSQCWPSSMSPYGVTRPQWVKFLCHDQIKILYHFYNSSFPEWWCLTKEISLSLIPHKTYWITKILYLRAWPRMLASIKTRPL